MSYVSTDNPAFQATAARWIAERHEVLVMIRYSHAAGSKDFEFFDSAEAFLDRLRGLPPRTCVIVFGTSRLPLRGRVDDDFLRRAMELVGDGAEYLAVGLEPMIYGRCSWYRQAAGVSHRDLIEHLRDRYGELIAFGPHPPWLEDGEEVISAVAPNADNSVTVGVY